MKLEEDLVRSYAGRRREVTNTLERTFRSTHEATAHHEAASLKRAHTIVPPTFRTDAATIVVERSRDDIPEGREYIGQGFNVRIPFDGEEFAVRHFLHPVVAKALPRPYDRTADDDVRFFFHTDFQKADAEGTFEKHKDEVVGAMRFVLTRFRASVDENRELFERLATEFSSFVDEEVRKALERERRMVDMTKSLNDIPELIQETKPCM